MYDVVDRIECDVIGKSILNLLLYFNLLNVYFKLCILYVFYIN